MKYKYIFFDFADTLVYKEGLHRSIINTLRDFGITVDENLTKERHKIVSEIFSFPDKTTKNFYDMFNTELLYALGIVPNQEMIDTIYKNLANLPWRKFEDTKVLRELNVGLGVISNWDRSLRKLTKQLFDVDFEKIIVSSEVEVSKPHQEIFEAAVSSVGVPPSKVLYIGDSIKLDIEPALKAGFNAILLDRENFYPSFNDLRIKSLYQLRDILET